MIALSLASAFSSAVSTTLKKASATRAAGAPGGGRLAGLGQPLWLAGLGADVVGVGLQVTALHYGALALVQPLLVSGLLFALVLRHICRGRMSRRELFWGLVLAACLGGFLVFSGATSSGDAGATADPIAAVVTGVAVLAAIAACLVLAWRTVPSTGRAALLGVAVGALYALTAALIKAATTVLAAHGVGGLLLSWQLYAVLALGVGGQVLTQLALQAGPINSSLPAVSTVDPLLSVLVGVLVYGERLHRGPLSGCCCWPCCCCWSRRWCNWGGSRPPTKQSPRSVPGWTTSFRTA